jgi:hypothetical protein
LRTLKTEAWGELYIFVAHEVASTLSFFFIGEVSITHPQFYFIFNSSKLPSFPCINSWQLGFSHNFMNYSPTWVLVTLFGLFSEEFLWQHSPNYVPNWKTQRFLH